MTLDDFTKRILPVKNKLYRFAMRLAGDPAEAEDMVQEVFLKVWDRRQDIASYQNAEAWCMRMVKNRFLDQVKSKRHQTTSRLPDNDWSSETPVHAHTPYQVTELNDTMQKVHRLIESLPDKQKQIIHLRDVEGYSYQEIADMLDIDINHVKVNLFRARNTLRKGLTNAENYGMESNG